MVPAGVDGSRTSKLITETTTDPSRRSNALLVRPAEPERPVDGFAPWSEYLMPLGVKCGCAQWSVGVDDAMAREAATVLRGSADWSIEHAVRRMADRLSAMHERVRTARGNIVVSSVSLWFVIPSERAQRATSRDLGHSRRSQVPRLRSLALAALGMTRAGARRSLRSG